MYPKRTCPKYTIFLDLMNPTILRVLYDVMVFAIAEINTHKGHWLIQRRVESLSRAEAGSNTSTVALRIIGGDEKENLESETVKYEYGRESHETWTQK
jgi:hypothetical protein